MRIDKVKGWGLGFKVQGLRMWIRGLGFRG